MPQPRRNRFGLDHYASSLGLICACRQQGNEGKWGEGQGKGESSLDLFSLAFCLFGFVLILFSRPLPAQICNRRNASLDMSSDLEAGLINWLHWTRRTSHEKWNSFKFRLPCLPMNLSSQVEQTIKWHFYLQNQTRPDQTQATPQPRKGTTTERSPTRDQNIQNSDVDCVWCGFWLTRNENTSRKKSNIYKEEEEGEKYHQDYRYTGMGASMMSYIWQKMNSNWVIHGETLRWALIHMKMILTYEKLIKLCTCINLLNGEIYHYI